MRSTHCRSLPSPPHIREGCGIWIIGNVEVKLAWRKDEEPQTLPHDLILKSERVKLHNKTAQAWGAGWLGRLEGLGFALSKQYDQGIFVYRLKILCSGQARDYLWESSRLFNNYQSFLILGSRLGNKRICSFRWQCFRDCIEWNLHTNSVCIARYLHTNCRPLEGATMYSSLTSCREGTARSNTGENHRKANPIL